MTQIKILHSNHIILYPDKQGVYSAEVGALVTMFEKSATEPKHNSPRYKNIVDWGTFNIRTLNLINQLSEPTASATKHNVDIICICILIDIYECIYTYIYI